MGLSGNIDLFSDGKDILWQDPDSGAVKLVSASNLAAVSIEAAQLRNFSQQQLQYTNGHVLRENSELKAGQGVSLFQGAGQNSSLVVTSSYLATPVSCTVTWSAGSVATINVPSGHGCVSNDAFVLQVATPASDAVWAQVLRVATVVDANNLTARLPFIPTAGPVSAVTFKRCIRNVVVDIDVDYNVAENPSAGASPARMSVVLSHIADSYIRIRGRNNLKYVVLAAGCDNCCFDVGTYPNGNSDTFKLYGPANNNKVTVAGQAPEDCASIQALEPAAFIGYMPCQGNIYNTRVKDVAAKLTTAGVSAFCIYADPTYTIRGTVLEGGEIKTVAGTADGLSFRPGSGFSPTNNNLIDVSLRDLVIGSAGGDCFALRTPMRNLSFQHCVIEGPGDTTKRGMYINNDCDVLEIEDQTFDLTNWVGTGTGFYIYIVAAIRTLIFRNCKFKGNASLKFLLMAGATAGVDTLVLDGCTAESGDAFMRFESTIATVPTVIIRGGQYGSWLTIANYRKTGGKMILEGPTITGASNGVVRSEGAGIITDVYGFATLTTPAQLAVSVSSGKVNLRTPFMSFDHTAAVLNNADGNEFITTAAGGTLTAGMPVIGNGTVWLNRRNFALTS